LPYIKLLEIYRRREEREPYDRIRERFNRRFNAYAPEWGLDPEAGLDLEGYPEVLERLQGIWQMPSMAMELLDTHLFRRDAGPTFDVPAYRELLFLYGIARDLAERDIPASGVDLLLPLGDDDLVAGDGPIVSLAPDLSPEPVPEDARFQLDLDVSTDQPPHLHVELPDSERGRPLDFQLEEDAPPRPPRRAP
jgi:pilus assembly protein FimV